ncbi:hypothetical protein H2200_003711 [Cladophialophora chaetospira]|uniref:Zn(2)-C6 fungal-type domain-containing protein n=1 Tax=Cladophialophora chaetospira TaxID=386627 RepID=A0AA38XFI2_9EURO|nr:hypothetical protein H2200_003711 [Cladophialophora chaetospira]
MDGSQACIARGQTYANGFGNPRRACDSCRNSKIRCEAGPDATSCQRCFKTGRHCNTSQAGNSGRPSKRHASSAQTTPHTLLDVNTTQPAIDKETPLLLPTLANYVGMDTGFGATGQSNVSTKTSETQPFQTDFSATIPQLDYLTRLGNLQQAIIADLELVKHCKAADKCPESTLPPELGYNSSFPLGSMLRNSQHLLEILDLFEKVPVVPTPLSNGFGSSNSSDSPGKMCMDVPTMLALFSCYVSLIRVYRTNLSAIDDSMPLLSGLGKPLPQLFPGLNLGGFSLEGRLDLQVRLILQVVQDMLGKLDARFGLGDIAVEKSVFEPSQSEMLKTMLEQEASEDPPLHEPRGPCPPLKEILTRLKQVVQAENANREG